MPYLVTKQAPRDRTIKLEDVLLNQVPGYMLHPALKSEQTNTRTYFYKTIKPEILNQLNIDEQIRILEDFYTLYKCFDIFDDPAYNYKKQVELVKKHGQYNADRVQYELESNGYKYIDSYDTFFIPKKKGGLRQIDAPCDDLKTALKKLSEIFNDFMCGATYHTSAFAYVKGRCATDAVKKHQAQKNRWVLKLDFSNFFGSTTMDFILNSFALIYPFSEIMKSERGENAVRNCLKLCMLDGGLPQGTPVSPIITNIMMIPIDHKLTNGLYNHKLPTPSGNRKEKGFTYCRYADDIVISHRMNFDYKEIEEYVAKVLRYYHAPFAINAKKTRYGSTAGSNWILGVMWNKENEITIGYKNKKRLKGMLSNYTMDKINHNKWDISDVQVMQGTIPHYRNIEGGKIDDIINKMSSKYNFDIVKAIKADLKSA